MRALKYGGYRVAIIFVRYVFLHQQFLSVCVLVRCLVLTLDDYLVHFSFFFIEYIYCNAVHKPKFPIRELHTLEPKWNGLSVNYRLQVFHYTFYSPSAVSVAFIIIPWASAVKLTLHPPWCSCSHPGSGRSHISPRDTLVQRGHSSSAGLAVWGGCRKAQIELITHSSQLRASVHTHLRNCPFTSWNNCSPSGSITHPEASTRRGNLTNVKWSQLDLDLCTELFRCWTWQSYR